MVTYLVHYDVNGNQDLTLEFTDIDFDSGAIGGFRFTDAYHSYQWMTFSTVQFEALTQQDIDAGYGGMFKLLAMGRNTDGANMVFFIENPNNMGEDGQLMMDVLLLSPDWGALWYQSGTVSATYMPQWVYSLSSYYGFDAGAGTIDYMSNQPAVDSANIDFVTDEGRTAVQFGGDGYIEVADPASLALDEWSIFLWVKTSVDSGRQDFLAQWYDNDGLYPSIDLGTVDGVLTAYYRGANNGSINTITGISIADNAWHSVAFVKTSTDLILYVDGVQVGTAAFSGIIDSDSNLYIGAWNGELLGHPMDHHFDGFVDDLHLYARAITASEVSTHHTYTTVIPSPTVTLVQDPATIQEGDVLTANVDLAGGSLWSFGWESFDEDSGSWQSIYTGIFYEVHNLTVTEDHSALLARIRMVVDGIDYYSPVWNFPILVEPPAAPEAYVPTEPTIQVELFGSDSYGDGWNNGSVTVTSSEGAQVIVFTGPANGLIAPDGESTILTLSRGATYTVAVAGGGYPSEIVATFTDEEGTELLAVNGNSGTVTFDTPAPSLDGGEGEGEAGESDWTFGGQLSDIVKVVRGQDASGAMSMMYLKNNAGSTDVYISPSVLDFAQFSLMTSGEHGWDGYPVCGEFGFDGCFIFGTSTGNVYKIQVGADGSPSSSSLIHAFGAGSVSSVSYSSSSQEWLMEHDGKVYTMPYAGGAVEMKMELPAGAKVVDFAVAPDGVALTLRMADFSLAAYIAGPDWSVIHDSSTMAAVVTAISPSDFNYFADLDMWIAASADGTSFVTTDDINNWLQ